MKSETKLLERSYHIPLAMFDDAFRQFQKKFVVPMNFVVTVILLVLAGDFVYGAVKEPTNTVAYLLVTICVALVLVRWYRMFKLRRSVHEALKEIEGDRYDLTVYEEGVVIRTEAPTVMEAAEAELSDETQSDEQKPAEEAEKQTESGGFQQLFPEEPAEAEDAPPPTEIYFGRGVKLLEYPEYFMVYLVRANFYVIPKKDFSENEIQQLSELFAKYQ